MKFLKLLFSRKERLCHEIEKDFINNSNYSEIVALPENIKEIIKENLQASIEIYKSDDESGLFILVNSIIESFTIPWILQNDYMKPLQRKMKTLIYQDDYGDTNIEGFEKEVGKFCTSRVDSFHDFVFSNIDATLIQLINEADTGGIISFFFDDMEKVMLRAVCGAVTSYPYVLSLDNGGESLELVSDPYEYERVIAEEFISLGYEAYATTGSGDQGADVIATVGGNKVVVQAKLYSQPVGNKAVQEVAAARGYYDAHYACVITNNTYTKSARELASSLDVLLLHHDDIREVFSGLNLIAEENDAELSKPKRLELVEQFKEALRNDYLDESLPDSIYSPIEYYAETEGGDEIDCILAMNNLVKVITYDWLCKNKYFREVMSDDEQTVFDDTEEMDSYLDSVAGELVPLVNEEFKGYIKENISIGLQEIIKKLDPNLNSNVNTLLFPDDFIREKGDEDELISQILIETALSYD